MKHYSGVIVWDLDETLIDSRHRTPRNPDGTVNLDHYRAHATRENIFKDTLYPLANVARKMYCSGDWYTVFCTARHMYDADYAFLIEHDLKAHRILSRDKAKPAHYVMRDADYKATWIKPRMMLKQFQGLPWFMYDDEKKVIARMRSLGIQCGNAVKTNQRLSNV